MSRSIDVLWETAALATRDASPALHDAWRDPRIGRQLAPVIAYEDLAPWLLVRTRQLGLQVGGATLADWQPMVTRAAAHQLLLDEELHELAQRFAHAGIEWAAIKGAARRLLFDAPLAHARTVADVDVLVAKEDAPRAVACLDAAGYVEHSKRPPDGHWHATARTRGRLCVEIHHAIGPHDDDDPAWHRLRATGARRTIGGHLVWVPSVLEALRHVVQHRLGSPGAWLSMRAWCDAASILVELEQRGELVDVETLCAGWPARDRRRATAFLVSAAAFAGASLQRAPQFDSSELPPIRAALRWRQRVLQVGHWMGERVEASALDAVYRSSGEPEDQPPMVRSVARRALDRLTEAGWRRLYRRA